MDMVKIGNRQVSLRKLEVVLLGELLPPDDFLDRLGDTNEMSWGYGNLYSLVSKALLLSVLDQLMSNVPHDPEYEGFKDRIKDVPDHVLIDLEG